MVDTPYMGANPYRTVAVCVEAVHGMVIHSFWTQTGVCQSYQGVAVIQVDVYSPGRTYPDISLGVFGKRGDIQSCQGFAVARQVLKLLHHGFTDRVNEEYPLVMYCNPEPLPTVQEKCFHRSWKGWQ